MYTRLSHVLTKSKAIFKIGGVFLAVLLTSVAVFNITQGSTPHMSELSFIETSYGNMGSVLPASCESNPNVANGDGNFTGCNTVTCWNGAVITPAAGQVCPNQPPVADAGIDRSITVPLEFTTPAGADASDPEGLPVTILWTSVVTPVGASAPSIRSGTTLVPTFSGLTATGTYTFRITVTDSGGLTASDMMNVVVSPVIVVPPVCSTMPCDPTDPTDPSGPGGGGGSSNPPPTGEIRANNKLGSITILRGTPVNITWSSRHTTSCRVSPTTPEWTGTSNSVGELDTPLSRIVYLLLCNGDDGSVDVPVSAVSVSPQLVSNPTLTASPRIVSAGGNTVLSWNLNGQTNCTLTNGAGTVIQSGISADSSLSVAVVANTTYTLTCPGGTATVNVEILPIGFET